MRSFNDIGVQIPQIYLPKAGTDLTKWAVIACDQYTSQPEYWHKVETLVGNNPSTLKLTFPEVYLEGPDENERIRNIQTEMRSVISNQLLSPHDGMIYVERTVSGRTRKGIMLALDLEQYDFSKGSQSLIRATEGTIIERLPPRIKIREGAALEFPHILVLIDDTTKTVIEPLQSVKNKMEKLYDFDLMFNSGHIAGYQVSTGLENAVIDALRTLAKREIFETKYSVKDKAVLLFAMGDGNHSLATAKAIWEKIKSTVGMDHPARYALVEIENVHDEALEFEPIHRVLFGLKKDIFAEMKSHFGQNYNYATVKSLNEMVKRVEEPIGPKQAIGVIGSGQMFGVIEISHPSTNLSVGTLQAFLDPFLKSGGAEKIDYVHGADVTAQIGSQSRNVGFYLPGMHKSDLFKTVILDGALPRKTFSMGGAHEKRFYLEARKIS